MFRWLVRGMQHHRSLRLTHKLWASGATLVSGSYVRRAHALTTFRSKLCGNLVLLAAM